MRGEVAQRLFERTKQQSAAAAEAGVSVLGIIGDANAADRIAAELRAGGRFAREFVPTDRALVGEVPDAAFIIEQQVERRVNEVGYVRRRHDRPVVRDHLLPTLQFLDRVEQEVVAVPRTEEGA